MNSLTDAQADNPNSDIDKKAQTGSWVNKKSSQTKRKRKKKKGYKSVQIGKLPQSGHQKERQKREMVNMKAAAVVWLMNSPLTGMRSSRSEN